MKISDVRLGHISVPLKKTFKTALRTVESIEDLVVFIYTDTGNIGIGEAPPTAVITGDTEDSVRAAIREILTKKIIGMDIENIEGILIAINDSMIHNTSAKAAVDLALYDLYGQLYKAPLYKLLGGYRNEIYSDVTISVNNPDKMAADSIEAVKTGYKILKIKVGKEPEKDIERLKAIRSAIGCDITMRIDANQGWKPKEAVRIITRIEDSGINAELIEQPVKAHDIEGMKFVTDNVLTPILADESIFSPSDALRVLQMRAADLINIKLMKAAGIFNALKICSLAETYGVECMLGCMLESKISTSAAAHLACGKAIITKYDLDGPELCRENPIKSGPVFDNGKITMVEGYGLGLDYNEIMNIVDI